MSSNVNLFSVGAGSSVSAGSAIKTAARPVVKTGSSQVSDFSQSLDQAQQARDNGSVKPEDASRPQAKDNAAEKPEQADGKAQEPEKDAAAGKPEDGSEAAEVPEDGKADAAQGTGEKPAKDADADADVPEADEKLAAVAAAMAEGAVAVQGQQPLAELSGYFKGDVRLQEAVNPQPLVQEAEPALVQQAAGGQQEKPLDSLQAVNVMEEMAPVDGDTPSVVKQNVQNVTPAVVQHAPNSIEALLGSRQAADANAVQGRADNGQQLLNLLPGQRTFVTVQETGAANTAENTVNVSQLNELVGQVQVVQTSQDNGEGGRGFAQQQNQQGMMNSQGQQQGMQMAGEAAFDVIAPGSEEQAVTSENMVQNQQNGMMGFQQTLNNVQDAGQVNAPQQTPQTAETYNVPQQIVEQARLLQNGQNSEMIIKLNPEHLGELSLKVSVNGNGGVTATFHTDNQQVRAILETTVIQLKQQLNEQGIKVDNVEVQTGLPDGHLPDGQAQQGFYQQGQGGQQVRSQQADLRDFEDTSEALAAEPVNNAPEVVHDSEGNIISGGVDYSV